MSDPILALQTAQAALLLASTDLAAIVGDRVLDVLAAEGAALPYVELGDSHVVGDDDQYSDRSEIYSNVHIWAGGPSGSIDCMRCAAIVRPLLGTVFALNGHTMFTAQFFKSVPSAEPNPAGDASRVAHLILTFQYRTAPVPS